MCMQIWRMCQLHPPQAIRSQNKWRCSSNEQTQRHVCHAYSQLHSLSKFQSDFLVRVFRTLNMFISPISVIRAQCDRTTSFCCRLTWIFSDSRIQAKHTYDCLTWSLSFYHLFSYSEQPALHHFSVAIKNRSLIHSLHLSQFHWPSLHTHIQTQTQQNSEKRKTKGKNTHSLQ